jgi:hypothetical protein
MRIYNLFRRADRVELVCAIPEDRPVPDFVQGPAWQFSGRVEGATIGSSSFNREAAEASVRYNGFYFFQLINASDLQFRVDQIGVRESWSSWVTASEAGPVIPTCSSKCIPLGEETTAAAMIRPETSSELARKRCELAPGVLAAVAPLCTEGSFP